MHDIQSDIVPHSLSYPPPHLGTPHGQGHVKTRALYAPHITNMGCTTPMRTRPSVASIHSLRGGHNVMPSRSCQLFWRPPSPASPGIVARMRAMPETHWREMALPSALRCTKGGFPAADIDIPGSSNIRPVCQGKKEPEQGISSPISCWFIALHSLRKASRYRAEFHSCTARPLPLESPAITQARWVWSRKRSGSSKKSSMVLPSNCLHHTAGT